MGLSDAAVNSALLQYQCTAYADPARCSCDDLALAMTSTPLNVTSRRQPRNDRKLPKYTSPSVPPTNMNRLMFSWYIHNNIDVNEDVNVDIFLEAEAKTMTRRRSPKITYRASCYYVIQIVNSCCIVFRINDHDDHVMVIFIQIIFYCKLWCKIFYRAKVSWCHAVMTVFTRNIITYIFTRLK